MFNGNSGYSLSDIAAVTSRNGNGFSDGNDWWVILLFLLCGYGNGGFGGFGGNGGTLKEEITTGFDMNNLENGIRGIQQGLCDGFYAQNTSLLTGFNGVQSALCQGFSGIQAQMSNDALVAQQCCCDTKNAISTGFANLNYNLATQSCDTRRAIADSSRDIIDAQNSGTRQILDFLTQDRIASLTAENQALKFAASQANQNSVIGAMIDAGNAEVIRRTATPCPVPAYVVPNPNCCYSSCGTF